MEVLRARAFELASNRDVLLLGSTLRAHALLRCRSRKWQDAETAAADRSLVARKAVRAQIALELLQRRLGEVVRHNCHGASTASCSRELGMQPVRRLRCLLLDGFQSSMADTKLFENSVVPVDQALFASVQTINSASTPSTGRRGRATHLKLCNLLGARLALHLAIQHTDCRICDLLDLLQMPINKLRLLGLELANICD